MDPLTTEIFLSKVTPQEMLGQVLVSMKGMIDLMEVKPELELSKAQTRDRLS